MLVCVYNHPSSICCYLYTPLIHLNSVILSHSETAENSSDYLWSLAICSGGMFLQPYFWTCLELLMFHWTFFIVCFLNCSLFISHLNVISYCYVNYWNIH